MLATLTSRIGNPMRQAGVSSPLTVPVMNSRWDCRTLLPLQTDCWLLTNAYPTAGHLGLLPDDLLQYIGLAGRAAIDSRAADVLRSTEIDANAVVKVSLPS